MIFVYNTSVWRSFFLNSFLILDQCPEGGVGQFEAHAVRAERGHADHGWLDTWHSFSFANWYDPDKLNFGALRVLNDDSGLPGKGFGQHPHRDMEIISIPLEGDLEHRDSLGNTAVIRKGEIQVMSAGTGVLHSEYNKNPDQIAKFLQIWIFPRALNLTPRYDQQSILKTKLSNQFQQILSPDPNDAGVWIHQDAWMNLADFSAGSSQQYQLHKSGNGVYVFVLSGMARIGDQVLEARDAFGIWDTEEFVLEAIEEASVLLIEIPMELPPYLVK